MSTRTERNRCRSKQNPFTVDFGLCLGQDSHMKVPSQMPSKRIEILLATWNGARFLPLMLDSLASQSLDEFYLIVSGGLSNSGGDSGGDSSVELPVWSMLYAGPDDAAPVLHAGAAGCEVLVMQFPQCDLHEVY